MFLILSVYTESEIIKWNKNESEFEKILNDENENNGEDTNNKNAFS